MNDETCEGPEAEEGSGGAGKAPSRDQPESVMEPQEESGRGLQQCWEAQWQQFLQTLQTPYSAWGNLQLSEATPWDDAKAFLASFEQVAEACQWPRGEWVARLVPALSGEAQQAFSLLAARDKEDYGKVKAAILRGDALRREIQRQHFRQFCCQELGDPRRMYSQLQELCCQWLKPERHTKEQILELLVLEQFLASLPVDVQNWIRAGGPESCAQAVALLEDFLRNQREDNTVTWQEPLQEWALGPLEAKEGAVGIIQVESCKEHAEIFKGTEQNVGGELTLTGTGITRPTLLLPPEGQDMAEVELAKALGVQVEQMMSPSKTGGTLHMVEQTPMQSNQQTTFWQVLPEDGENVGSIEGAFSPRLGLAPHPVKKEETFLLDSVASQRLPGQESESDDGTGTQLKVKNPLVGRNESHEIPRTIAGNVPVTAEERFASTSRQGTEPRMRCKESGKLQEGLGPAYNNPSPVDTEGEKASFSKYGRRYHSKSGLILEHSGEECNEDTPLGGKILPNSDLEKHHSSQTDVKNYDCLEVGVRIHSDSLTKHEIIHTVENPHTCPDCGKSFSWRSNLLRHQNIHTGEKPHKCPECGKRFRYMTDVRRHETVHTGKKPYQCPVCRKKFSRKSHLLRHEIIHTGIKPHTCPECGKCFRDVADLRSHQTIHSGKTRHQCPECGKCFSWRAQLLRHQKTHTGEKPHKCPECGKQFRDVTNLKSHQAIHTGQKPHQCPECRKKFSRKSHLLRHQIIHTGEKPHRCPECGKHFRDVADLKSHQTIHTGKTPHQCPECGKCFSWRAQLLRHQKIHSGERPHKCPECGKQFRDVTHLRSHQTIHTGRKPHQCTECRKRFSRRSHLLRHHKIHTGEKLDQDSAVNSRTQNSYLHSPPLASVVRENPTGEANPRLCS
ncbi:zinc finger and SCAN domain-containing protein 12-like [Tiliqua scincoides]|uniref:zinc finger and SCAN domain-containing protein 12-like n=1 Tax=Tiliqua scincoides TaxID=71010 RepID=UPI0034628347